MIFSKEFNSMDRYTELYCCIVGGETENVKKILSEETVTEYRNNFIVSNCENSFIPPFLKKTGYYELFKNKARINKLSHSCFTV
jgi:hypothetical protein